MLEHLPPRRDPRVLLLDLRPAPATYAVLDPWEVRGVGELPRRGPSAALQRLALQVRPSHVLVVRAPVPRPLRGFGRGLTLLSARGLAVVALTPTDLGRLRALSLPAARLIEAYPELRHVALTGRLRDSVRLAHAVLLHHPLPPRSYAPRLPARPTSRVAR